MTILNEIKARCEAATPGPWLRVSHGRTGIAGDEWFAVYRTTADGKLPTGQLLRDLTTTGENALFAAHARTDIPRLVKALEKERLQRISWMRVATEQRQNATEQFIQFRDRDDAEIESILKGEA